MQNHMELTSTYHVWIRNDKVLTERLNLIMSQTVPQAPIEGDVLQKRNATSKQHKAQKLRLRAKSLKTSHLF